jgi:hypothetical protein
MLLAAAVLSLGLATPGQAVAPAAGELPPETTVLTSMSLSDIDCVAARVCFGVGAHLYVESRTDGDGYEYRTVATRPLVVTRTRRGWREVDFPAIPQGRSGSLVTTAALDHVSCTSTARRPTRATTYCLAIGAYASYDEYWPDINDMGPLTAVYNRGDWRLREKPQQGCQSCYLWRTDVQCTSPRHCYALKAVGDGRNQYLDTWDVRSWHSRKIRKPSFNSSLYALSCWDERRCVGVGSREAKSNTFQPLIMKLTGRRWRTFRVDAVGAFPSGVDCRNASSCVAVGAHTSLVRRGAMKGWRVVPMQGSRARFDGVACPRRTNCIAVGGVLVGNDALRAAQTFDGRRWHGATPPTPGAGRWSLRDIACASPRWCVAVSDTTQDSDGSDALLRWNGRGWSRVALSVRPHPGPPA